MQEIHLMLTSAACREQRFCSVHHVPQGDGESSLGEGSQLAATQQAEEDVLQVLTPRVSCDCLPVVQCLGTVDILLELHCCPLHRRALWQSFLATCPGHDAAVACPVDTSSIAPPRSSIPNPPTHAEALCMIRYGTVLVI